MSTYAVRKAGFAAIQRMVTCPPALLSLQLAADEEALPAADGVSDATHYIDDTEFVPFPERPHSMARWDWSAMAWVAPDELARAAAEARVRRNAELARTDWTQVADAPLTAAQVQAWAAYRKALRDLPSAPGWPTVDFPLPLAS